ncbi:MAG: type II secretion system protein GspN [Sandaracinus sp.]
MATSTSTSPSRFALSERARTLLMRFLVFPFYFLCCFFSSAYETFPYDRVRDFAIHAIESQVPGSEVDIVSLEPAWISGVEAQGVRIRLPAEEGETRRAEVTIPRLYARAGIFAYLFGTTDVTFEIETDGGGTITGEVTDARSGSGEEEHELTHVVARLEHVDLRRLGVIRHYLGLPVEGIVAGDIDVSLSDELAQTSGHVTLTIEDLAIGDGNATLNVIPGSSRGLAVERIAAGDVNLQIDIEHGVGRVGQLVSDGEDAQLLGQGTIRVLRPFRMSALDLLLRINVSQAYRDRNDRTRAIFGLVGLAPEARAYTAPDGAFQLRLQGALGGRVLALPAGTATLGGH